MISPAAGGFSGFASWAYSQELTHSHQMAKLG
jgi:hypothetical protein